MKLRLIKSAVALACGTLMFLSCADFDVWPLAWIAWVPMFFVILDEDTKNPAFYGFLCGLTGNGGGFYWIVPFLQRFGHLPIVAAIPIFLLLISYQAITWAAFCWLTRRLHDHLKLGVVWLAPVCYVAVELVVPYVFPWYYAITQAWVRPVIQIAELTGPLGVSFLLILCNAALFEAIAAVRKKSPVPWRHVAPALLLVVGNVIYGYVRIHQVEASRAAAPKLKLGVVQANVGIHEKWNPNLAHAQLEQHQLLSAELEKKGAQLIVWPESSYPYLHYRHHSTDWPESDERRALRGFKTPLLLGSLTVGKESKYPFNSALLLDADGQLRGRFDKNILMVFGEYIPYYEQMLWLKKLIPATSNWARGTDVEVFEHGGARLGPMICYEDIFPSFGRRLVEKNPNLLVNITNDAWFGRTSEPWEHLALSVYRTVEMRLDLVRAVNTGVSAHVDSTGRVVWTGPSVDPDEGPPPPPFVRIAETALQEPQKIYAAVGDSFGAACLALALVLGLRARSRAGMPVRWPLVGLGAGALAAAILVGALASGRAGLALALLARRTVSEGANLTFSTGIYVLIAAMVGAAVAGVVVRRKAVAPLETLLAVASVLVLPAVVVGRLEGEQAGLVIGALAATGIALLAARLYARRLTSI